MTTMIDQLTTTLGIYDEARKILDYAVAAAASINVALPAKQYVTVGQAVHDCEQVVFEMTNLQTGLPADTTPGGSAVRVCPPPWSLIGSLSIVRCGPELNNDGSVSYTVQEAFAKTQAIDALILQAAVSERVAEMFGSVLASISWPPPTGEFIVTSARITAAVSH